MARNVYAEDVGAVTLEATAGTAGEVTLVNPPRGSIPDVVFGLHDDPDPPSVRLLADRDALRDVMADYIVAGRAADLVAAETLSLRWDEDLPETALLVSEGLVVSLVPVPGRVGGLAASESPFVEEARDHYGDRWADAEPFRLRSPPISRLRQTLADEVGNGAAADFDAVLAELPAARGDGDGLDEVTVALVVGARHGVQLYDISRWGENIGLASKATFSRKKGELEDCRVITTEKVPIDVGRPRLRLRLTRDLRAAEVPELTARVRERVEAAQET